MLGYPETESATGVFGDGLTHGIHERLMAVLGAAGEVLASKNEGKK